MRRLILATLLGLSLAPAATAQAACEGTDLRQTLSAGERAELDALIADMPFATGNHWRAEKDGEVIHLVGTMHLSDPRLDGPVDRLRPVIAEAGALLLEMPQAEQAKLIGAMSDRPELLLLTDTTLPELMPEDDWQALVAAAKARGIPGVMAAKFRPWYLSMMLALPACAQAAMQEQNGLDVRLEALADEAGVPTLPLEPFDTAFGIFNAAPLEEQIEMMSMALATEDQGEDGMATTVAAYFDERPGEMWALSGILMQRSGAFAPGETEALIEETNEVLLASRNRAWLPVILEAAATTDGPVIAAFGAAHLPGAEGVARLLEEDGFTLTREPF